MKIFRKQIVQIPCLALVSLFLMMPVIGSAETFDHEHGVWNLLLKEHVRWNPDHTASQVDYAQIKSNRVPLDLYLGKLSAVSRVEFDSFNRDQELAFLINAYNALTVKLILTEYPDLKSIKELGSFFSSPWKKKFFRLLGESQSLDGIEHGLIRGSGRYNEPLIHFAVNCASIGCPALLDEAYVAEKLDQQLLESTRSFLRDRSRNRFNADVGTLEISSIFDWYAEDFGKGWRGYDSREDFFRTHADWITGDTKDVGRLVEGPLKVKFLDYDWDLNVLQ
jgi:hypothetical protein